MKYICRQPCQIRVDGRILFCDHGSVWDLDDKVEIPDALVPLDGEDYKLDFLKATEDELMEAEWNFVDAVVAIGEACDIKLKKGSKRNVVDQILDARYRKVD